MRPVSARLTLSASIIAICASSVSAQEAAEDEFELDPIILRGELIERPIQDNPTSVSVVTGEELERRGDQTLKSVIQEAPNVSVLNSRQGFAIRGISQRGLGGGGQGLTISTQVDGIALPGNRSIEFGPYSTWDVDQVEILRGPQSTQQGRNALAGAIVIRTNDPTYEREFALRGGAGNFNSDEAAFMFNTPIVDNRLAFRLTGERTTSDGFVENPTRDEDDYDALTLETLRAKMLWEPFDNVETIFSYTRNKHERGDDLIERDAFPDDRISLSNEEAFYGVESDLLGLRVNWDINDTWSLETETSYFDGDYERQQDFDGTAVALGLFRQEGPQRAFEQDVRLRFDLPSVRGVFGLFYGDTLVQTDSDTNADACTQSPLLPCGLASFQRNNGSRSEIENYALYGEADIDADAWMRGLSFTVGARYDYEKQNLRSREMVVVDDPFGLVPPALIPPTRDVSGSTSYTAFLPKIGVTRDWSETISTSYTLQRGYRSGGQALNNFTGDFSEFDAEFTWNHELAFRGEFNDGRLVTNANVFYTRWKDQQVTVDGPSGNLLDFTTENAGESKLYGFELSVQSTPIDELQLFANVGYTNTEFVDFEVRGEDFSGNRFPGAPEWTGAVGGSYSFANGIVLSADVVYTGSSFGNAANDRSTLDDDRVIVNASIGYETENWNAYIYARNLFDKDYITDVVGDETIRAGDPLTVGAFVNITF